MRRQTATLTSSHKEPLLLLSLLQHGDDALEIYFTFGYDEIRESYATVIVQFDTYCAEQLNQVHERYLFRPRVQAKESFIRDQIVFGTNDHKFKQKLLQDNKLTLVKAEQVCKAAEMTAAQNEMWYREQKQTDAVKLRERTKQQQFDEPPAMFKCRRCGRTHGPRSCPAFGKVCRKFQGQNNFAVRCKVNRPVREVRSTEDSEAEFYILGVSVNGFGRACDRDWVVRAQLADTTLDSKVGTGSQHSLPTESLAGSNCILRSNNEGVIKHLGVMTAMVAIGSNKAKINFFVASITWRGACVAQQLVRYYGLAAFNAFNVAAALCNRFNGPACMEAWAGFARTSHSMCFCVDGAASFCLGGNFSTLGQRRQKSFRDLHVNSVTEDSSKDAGPAAS
ncbi:hypothetical protein HPB49_003961 [Dermacentor silvarum]|uniref:Uncharacterized protein n=1 Tax=Dermacentor silvarum TaxID=543639 RepID=A0ACB8C215_DERSI|nr:hypothetical protein HPB49_003961 [Dermacentor silvarum]